VPSLSGSALLERVRPGETSTGWLLEPMVDPYRPPRLEGFQTVLALQSEGLQNDSTPGARSMADNQRAAGFEVHHSDAG
jgi:hypothetical protein